ncbi:hypothetical protein D3C79_702300 [compost metagenome]
MSGRIAQARQQLRRNQRQPAFRLIDQGQHEQVLSMPVPQFVVAWRAGQLDAERGQLRQQVKRIRDRVQGARLDRLSQADHPGSRVAAHAPHPVAAHGQHVIVSQRFRQLCVRRRAVDEGGQGQGNR